jgi:hypothetical protein
MGRGWRGDREVDPRRRPWIHGVIGLALVAGVAAIWAAVPRDGATGEPAMHRGGPRLAIDQELIDFGAVRYNQFVEARFRLKNVGDQPLRLPASPPIEVVEGC